MVLRSAALFTFFAIFMHSPIEAQTGVGDSAPSSLSLVPLPLSVEVGNGKFTIDSRTRILCPDDDPQVRRTVELSASHLRAATGLLLPVTYSRKIPRSGVILFSLIEDDSLGSEGYRLTANNLMLSIHSEGAPGLLYGGQSILQLLPPEAFRTGEGKPGSWSIPAVRIVDRPRYGWRGMMLDVSRHFFPSDFVKRFIDFLVMHKMNRFHWHLTDDQGWRIEIPRYPRLIEIGAWRVDKEDIPWTARPPQQTGELATYGGFYRQEEIRDIVRYASERHVMVIPEIEMPAHVSAVLAAHPELSCTGGPFTVPPGGLWPITDICCAGNDSTFTFLENILEEVAKLFPGPYVHIGGDEANKKEWQRCPRCQERIASEGLADEAELQSYFIKRIEKTLTRLGKRLIGWDEILEGGLAPQATVMSWRGVQGGIVAAREGHDVVMSPTSHCYIDYYQGIPDAEPLAIGGFLPLRTVYSYEPTPDSLTEDQAQHILGAQANLWTEYVHDPPKAEYMIFPRIAAIAEVCWSPKSSRDWKGFTQRLERQMERYQAAGINVAQSVYAIQATDSLDPATGNPVVTLQSEIEGARIHYTLDGSTPSRDSPGYSTPIIIDRSATLRAAVIRENDAPGPVLDREYSMNRARGATVKLARPFDVPFGDSEGVELVDNLRGTYNLRDRRWYGVRGSDFEAVLELSRPVPISRITAGFFHESAFGAFLPDMVEVSVSEDGNEYRVLRSIVVTSNIRDPRPAARDVVVSTTTTETRYVKVRAVNRGPLPPWHKNAGAPTWLILDEIIIE